MRLVVLTLFAFLIFMNIPSPSGGEEGPIPTHGIKIEQHWIDVTQSQDKSQLEVVEYIFFNNSGSDIYNGSLYSWVPGSSVVRSRCCGDALNMGCRMLEAGQMLCFDVRWYDNNIVSGEPFSEYSFLSYYGQTAELSVIADSQNSSYSDSLLINVTLGKQQIIGDYPNVTDEGIHLTTNTQQAGVMAEIYGGGMPEKLGMIMTLNITNLTPNNDTIDLELNGLPDGWSGLFILEGNIIKNVSLAANESKEVILHIQLPSYMLEIQLNYFIYIEGADEPEKSYLFEKKLLYDSHIIETYVYILRESKLDARENLRQIFNPEWDSNSQRMWYALGSMNLKAGDMLSFTLSWKNETNYSIILLATIILVLAAFIAFVVIRKRRHPAWKSLKGEKMDRSDLEEKKRKILLAIKRLKEDYEAGNIPPDVYEDLLASYKNSAIEIMKKMNGPK